MALAQWVTRTRFWDQLRGAVTATDGITRFDASSHVTYSEEEPNSLTPEQVGAVVGSVACGLSYPFGDLMRAAEVEAIVTRSISGRLT